MLMVMKKIFYILLTVILAAVALSSCTKMNDFHDEYLKDGPIIYVGKVDSMSVYSGRERVQVNYYITDPRAKELCFYWNNLKDSIKIQVPEHDPLDVQTVLLDQIAEGDHTFQVYSYDGKGHRSIRFEKGFTTYGNNYISTLNNRRVASAACADNVLTLTYGSSSSTRELGVEVSFTDVNGAAQTAFIETALLGGAVIIEGVDPSKEITSRSAYTPDDTCIDVFYSPSTKVVIAE